METDTSLPPEVTQGRRMRIYISRHLRQDLLALGDRVNLPESMLVNLAVNYMLTHPEVFGWTANSSSNN